MTLLVALLLLLSVICFALEAFKVVVARVNLVALGLALFVLVFLIQALNRV